MRKNLLVLSAAGSFTLLSGAVLADIPVTTPGFSISVSGLYLQPNADNMTYAVYTTPLPLTTPNWQQLTVKPSYHGAFDLGLMYNFCDPTNHANLDWLHLNTRDSDSYSTSTPGTSVAPPYYFGPLAQALVGTSASSTANFDIDNVNLVFGHLINISNNIQLDPFAGLQFAYLYQDIITNNVGSDSSSRPYSITSNYKSRFAGLGPRLGIDGTYFFNCAFGLTAKMAGALMVGSMQSDSDFNSFGAGNPITANTKLADQTLNKVVPEMDGALEANYRIPLKSNGSSVTFALGYMVQEYFNAINQVVPTALVPGAFNGGTIAIETSEQSTSHLSMNGPYFNITWKI